VSGYGALADRVQREKVEAEELVGLLIDLTAAAHTVNSLLSNDPSATSVMRSLHDVEAYTETIIGALAGPDADEAAWVRARAAFAVAKQGTFWVVQAGDAHLSPVARKELLAAALRCLDS
jgi:hypothetical protein